MAILGNPTKYQDFPQFETVGDGVTVSFELPWNAGSVNNVDVFVGGSIQAGTFTIVGRWINFSSSPAMGEKIVVKSKGMRSVNIPKVKQERKVVNPTATNQTVFSTAPYTYQPGTNNVAMYVNGSRWALGSDFEEIDSGSVGVLGGHTFSLTDTVELVIGYDVDGETWTTAETIGYGNESVSDALDARLPEIANYAAIRAYTGQVTAYYVRGVANIFDGGAGVFRVDSADTTTADNGGTVLVDAAARRWRREFSVSVNPKWFGAKGDGVSSDTASIQAAINSGAGAVRFPKGVFYSTGTVNVTTGGVCLVADDPTSSVIKGNGSNILFAVSAGSISASNLGFDTCSRAFNSSESHVDCEDFSFSGCRFTNITLRAITYYDSVSDISGFSCRNCYFESIGSGVYLSVKSSVKNIFVTGNTFKNVAGDQQLSGAVLIDCADQGLLHNYKNSHSIIVSGNTIDGVYGVYSGPETYTLAYGIFVVGADAKIIDNSVRDVRTTNGNLEISPIGIYAKCVSSIISKNALTDAGGKYAIYSVGASFDQGSNANGVGGNSIVADNIITYDAVTPSSDVCILTQSNHVRISGNRLYGNTATILAFDAWNASVSVGKSIAGNQLVSDGLVKIVAIGSCVTIADNLLDYTGSNEMRTCGAGSPLQVFNSRCVYYGDFPGASVSKQIRSVVVNGNVLSSRSFATTRTGIYGGGSGASTTTFSGITVVGNNTFNFTNPIIFENLDYANVQCSNNVGVNQSPTYWGMNGAAGKYVNFHKNNNVGVGLKLSNAVSQASPNGTIYYITTDNAGARVSSTNILA